MSAPEQDADPAVRAQVIAFGQVVRAKRKALGLSQEKLAETAGCDRQSINRVENARHSPNLPRLFALAAALGTPLSEMFAAVELATAPKKATS